MDCAIYAVKRFLLVWLFNQLNQLRKYDSFNQLNQLRYLMQLNHINFSCILSSSLTLVLMTIWTASSSYTYIVQFVYLNYFSPFAFPTSWPIKLVWLLSLLKPIQLNRLVCAFKPFKPVLHLCVWRKEGSFTIWTSSTIYLFQLSWFDWINTRTREDSKLKKLHNLSWLVEVVKMFKLA